MRNYFETDAEREAAITRAVDRDLVDAERLERFHDLVANLLDAVLPDAHDMSHPDARWHPDDLVDVLQGQLKSIRWEQNRLRTGPLVLE
jgi:hypothetical protein